MKPSFNFAIGCVAACLILFILPEITCAERTAGKRQLLVVSDNPAPVSAAAKDPKTMQITSGSANSTVGEGIGIPAVQKHDDAQGSAVQPAGEQSKTQQQVLGRKGAPAVRQATQDDILPFCDPTDGVICSDRDRYELLNGGASIISLARTFPFFRVRPFTNWEGSSKSSLDLLTDSFTDALAGTFNTGLDVQAFDEQFSSSTGVTNTLASTALNLGPVSSLKVSGDKTGVTGKYVWNTLRPLFNVINGLPVGLQTVTDAGATGRK